MQERALTTAKEQDQKIIENMFVDELEIDLKFARS
jgi:hypothetical protein